jgi:hypothetical protein
MGASTTTKLEGWRTAKRAFPSNEFWTYDVVEPCALGINRAAYVSDPESSAYTLVAPADGPTTADQLRDDLNTNVFPPVYTSMNALRVAYENLRSLVEDILTRGHETTDKWQGVPTKKLIDSLELHYLWIPKNNWNSRSPVWLGFVLAPNHASSGGTLTVTYDRVGLGLALAASVMADGALVDTIPAVTDVQTNIDEPIMSYWGKVAGGTTVADGLFLKTISSSNSGASRLQIAKLLIAYKTM